MDKSKGQETGGKGKDTMDNENYNNTTVKWKKR